MILRPYSVADTGRMENRISEGEMSVGQRPRPSAGHINRGDGREAVVGEPERVAPLR